MGSSIQKSRLDNPAYQMSITNDDERFQPTKCPLRRKSASNFQKDTFRNTKGYVLRCERITFASQKDIFGKPEKSSFGCNSVCLRSRFYLTRCASVYYEFSRNSRISSRTGSCWRILHVRTTFCHRFSEIKPCSDYSPMTTYVREFHGIKPAGFYLRIILLHFQDIFLYLQLYN